MKIEIAFNFSIKVNEHDLLSRTSWRRLQRIVKKRDSAICQICGTYSPKGHVDHIKPLASGGTDALDNLQWTCGPCNLSKGVSDPEVESDSHKQLFRIEVNESEGVKVHNLMLDKGKILEIARGVLNGRSLSLGEWTGKSGSLSRSEFETMRGELLEVGLIKWVNPEYKQQGLELTQAGKMFFEKLIRSE